MIPPRHAQGLVAQVYHHTEQDFGILAPPVALHSPAPASLAATWLMLRETLLADGHASRTAKETVATEVSRANDCPYCVDVHQAVLDTLPRNESLPPLTQRAATTTHPTNPTNPVPHTPTLPLTPRQATELHGVATTFHYINRMVTLFLTDSPMPARTPAPLHRPIMHTTALAMRPTTPGPLTPGTSLHLLPPAPPHPTLQWAHNTPHIADAFTRALTAINHGARWIPPPVQQHLHTHLTHWNGNPPPLSRAWLTQALTTLPTTDIPTARLALLTALAPHQTLPQDITTFKNQHPTDRQLIELTSWAALTTALHIANHTHPPHHTPTPHPTDHKQPNPKPDIKSS